MTHRGGQIIWFHEIHIVASFVRTNFYFSHVDNFSCTVLPAHLEKMMNCCCAHLCCDPSSMQFYLFNYALEKSHFALPDVCFLTKLSVPESGNKD
jgi:hypothetical protein